MSLPKVFFEVPYPNPPISYYDLPQSVRDQWAAWAKANPLGWLDYHYEIRQAPDAYYICTVSDMMVNGGTTTIYNPPQWVPRIRPAIDGVSVNVTIGDTLSVRTSRYLAEPVTVAIWATATDPTQADVDNAANKFIGAFTFPASTPAFSSPDDLGPEYVAAFATLAADLGDFLSVWAFLITNGNMQYVAGYSSQVTEVSWAGQLYYWPLNDLSGPRRSIAAPNDLSPSAVATQVAGPIDEATYLDGTAGDQLQASTANGLSPDGQEWSLNLWVKFDALTTDQIIIRKANTWATADQELIVMLSQGSDQLFFTWSNGITSLSNACGANTLAGATAWTMVTLCYDPSVPEIKSYVDGALVNTAGVTIASPVTTAPWTVGAVGLAVDGITGAVADVGWWQRALAAAEVTALYNGGAGLRYPYQ